ncbi:MAG TPA: regulatory protein RecX [Lacibacter sp.]|nr:regulatory protein RecX [Lacibacter sp.]HMO90480.1 regulatory protein RecX [Lacibacter sp.]HMP87609.1 regulatory protein RecX [Lacibacter sp.]
MSPQHLTPQQALQKIKHFCAYQERCHSEVKEKLYGYGLHKAEVEDIISKLIEEDYLNEERFAVQFAGGHFRLKKWGRVKIRHELKQRQVSEYCIRKGLREIPGEDYEHTLRRLAEEKLAGLRREKNHLVKKRKLHDYLLRKGYEAELIREVVQRLQNEADA